MNARMVHEYESYCILKSPSGFMEGHFEFSRPNRTRFLGFIPRLYLDASAEADRH